MYGSSGHGRSQEVGVGAGAAPLAALEVVVRGGSAALACRAGILLTGDSRDFDHFMNRPEITSGARVMTVADFLRTLVE